MATESARDCVEVAPESELLERVIALGDRHKKTIGMLPHAAFSEYASNNRLWAGVDSDGDLLGYVLFRDTGHDVKVVHLVVDTENHHGGIARWLIDQLANKFSGSAALTLKCRNDYGLNDFWPKLGFTRVGEIPGRSKERHLLTTWRRSNGHADLLSWVSSSNSRIPVLMDANVFFAYVSDTGSADELSATAVLEVQLGTQIEPLISPEILTEIGRKEDIAHKNLMSERAQIFPNLAVDDNSARMLANRILSELGLTNPRAQHASDAVHIAYASLAGIEFFVTNDQRLLQSKSRQVAENYGVRTVSLGELVRAIDSYEHADRYSPASLRGTTIQTVEMAEAPAIISKRHQNFACGEPKESFRQTLESLLIDTNASSIQEIVDHSNKPIGLLGSTIYEDQMRVRLLRTNHSKLGHTVARTLVAELRLLARNARTSSVEVTDLYLTDHVRKALELDGFTRQSNSHYVALCHFEAEEPSHFIGRVIGAAKEHSWNLERLETNLEEPITGDSVLEVEYSCRPVLLDSKDVDTYMIPIDPGWAYDLLGSEQPNLFPRQQELGLSAEHVYFRTPSGSYLTFPSRILWYRTDRGVEPGAIIAYSYLRSVTLYDPKDAYRRFSRLGIFSLDDIERQANEKGVQVLEFFGTLRIERPIHLDELKEIAAASDVNIFFQGPWKLPALFKSKLLRRINIDS